MAQNLHIDNLDKKILSFITKNARIPFLEVARECGVSGALIHQRVNRLTSIGVINGSEFIISPKSIGYYTCAFIGVFLEKANMYTEVVRKLNKIPEIVECHYTTGAYGIFIKVYAKNNDHLRSVLVDNLQNISGISSTETFISLEENFKRQVSVNEVGKED